MAGYKTSVIIPVYNTERYVDECIRSVLNQTQKEVEVILIDDGSTDRSYEIMFFYAERYANIRVFRQENKKLGAARNLGMESARGKYILFLDSDDYIKENCLEELYNYAERKQLDFITYDSEIFVDCTGDRMKFSEYDRSTSGIAADKVYCGREFLNSYYKIGGVFVSACLAYYNAGFLREHQLYFEEQVYYEDNEFSLKVYYCAKRMMYLPQKLYVRRYRENSIMTSDCGIVHLQSAFKMNEKCMRILLQRGIEENKEGIRAVISNLANRLLKQIQSFQNKKALYDNQYMLDFCSFFTECDEGVLFSNIGLGLAFDFYCIFTMILDKGFLAEESDMEKMIRVKAAILRNKIEDTITELLAVWALAEGKIIIYGTGDIADRIVFCYGRLYGKDALENRIIFANTRAGEGSVYFGKYPVMQIGHMGDYPVSMVIVASTRYEREMCDQLKQLYGNRYFYVTYREIANISLAEKKSDKE